MYVLIGALHSVTSSITGINNSHWKSKQHTQRVSLHLTYISKVWLNEHDITQHIKMAPNKSKV